MWQQWTSPRALACGKQLHTFTSNPVSQRAEEEREREEIKLEGVRQGVQVYNVPFSPPSPLLTKYSGQQRPSGYSMTHHTRAQSYPLRRFLQWRTSEHHLPPTRLTHSEVEGGKECRERKKGERERGRYRKKERVREGVRSGGFAK